MTNSQFNPAARVHQILVTARNISGGTARAGWAQVFNIDATDPKPLLVRLSELMDQIDQTIGIFEHIPGVNRDLYLRALGEVRQAIGGINLEAPWDHTKSRLSDSIMVGLEFSVDAVRQYAPEEEIPIADLDSLLKDVQNLISTTLKSEIDHDLKAALVAGLEQVRQAILLYRLRGAKGLTDALDSLVGALVRAHHTADVAQKEPLISKVAAIAGKLNTLVSLALNVRNLLPPGAKEILGLPPG